MSSSAVSRVDAQVPLLDPRGAFYAVFDSYGGYIWSDTIVGTLSTSDRVSEVVSDARGVVLIAGRLQDVGPATGIPRGFARLFAP